MPVKHAETQVLITDFDLPLDQHTALRILRCTPDSPVYQEVLDTLAQWEPVCREKLRPRALLSLIPVGEVESCEALPQGVQALMAVSTLGGDISALSTDLFAQGDYLGGMAVDAIADCFLGAMDAALQQPARALLAKHGLGATQRIEAPMDYPMARQSAAVRASGALERLGIGITSGYMIDPVKSHAFALVLTHDPSRFQAQHDCTRCPLLDCPMRRHPVITLTDGEAITCPPRHSLLDMLGGRCPAACGGRGTCGKCRIRVVSGELAITPEDSAAFSEAELNQGYRLACRAYPKADLSIAIHFQSDAGFTALGGAQGETALSDEALGVAIDMGTTTLAFQLVGLASGARIATHTAVNSQRRFGADVISRIEASNQGHGPQLRALIQSDLREGLWALLKDRDPAQVGQIALCGNTTMVHLLMGYDCGTLGVAPFTPVNIALISGHASAILGPGVPDAPVTILPGISAYVGGDIVAGLLALDMDGDKTMGLIDIGTNGEIALCHGGKVYGTATAAGPAFEGGNISCGSGSVPGAICDVSIEGMDQVKVRTIGDGPAQSICGTGIISATAALLRNGLMDESGLLADDLSGVMALAGNVTLTQKDIREVQLAKAAIRAGLETLLFTCGLKADEVEKLYLAGGFGSGIQVDQAVAMGLLPPGLGGRIVAAGNAALAGVTTYLMDKDAPAKLARIMARAQEVNLASHKAFQSLFMAHMGFEEVQLC